jgi:hypothetical protein
MANKRLPLGYLVSDDILREYTQKLTDHPMLDLHVTAYAKAMAIIKAGARLLPIHHFGFGGPI